ncbi:FAD-dependent monooxygenase [Tardiphaga sp. 709]|uniref:FAD-dependent monooxygenase n=1 Tax=Tardiphaga sp. 709 TaxID=3076039 RepID=UPI0028E1D052|nr:FAD-dependent monooxygenase [Tardiphaga sp. 709]WNV11798.1 FAD-dependent monooxygenase [Tardiphaga sp. 709]
MLVLPQMSNFDADVIVVGAGPVGAGLAGDLGRRKISTIVLEQTDGIFRDPRMHAVNIRTMEFMRRWGLEERLRNCGWPQDHGQDIIFATSLDGYELGRIPWPCIADMAPPPESPTFAQRCPQSWFNPILLDFARAQPCTDVRLQWRYDSFIQHQDFVEVHATNLVDDTKHTLRARYLVGCDGGKSRIRDALGVDRESSPHYGYAAEAIFHSRELASLHNKGNAGRYTMVRPEGMSISLLPFDGKDLYRLTLMVEASKVSIADMHKAIKSLVAKDFEYELTTPVLGWINRETNASKYRVDRVLLAGDAAHGMPPTGGFGMNTGLIDAADLGWKLAAVVQGWGGDALLDAYDVERRNAVARTVRIAGSIYRDWVAMAPVLKEGTHLLTVDSPEAEEWRRATGKRMADTFRREFNPIGGALGYRYEASPICIPDGTEAPFDSVIEYEQTARPGHRAPHVWLDDGKSTLDLYGDEFVFLDASGDASDVALSFEAAANRLGIPFSIHRSDNIRLADAYDASFVLVRPDGHVAWRSKSGFGFDASKVLAVACGIRDRAMQPRTDIHTTAQKEEALS